MTNAVNAVRFAPITKAVSCAGGSGHGERHRIRDRRQAHEGTLRMQASGERAAMIAVRRDAERRHVRSFKQDVRLTFLPGEPDGPMGGHLGALVAFEEIKLPPGGRTVLHPGDEVEIVTYLFRGTLAHEDTTGRSGVIHAGEFQRLTTGRGVRHEQTNSSHTDEAHLFQLSMRPSEAGLDTAHAQKRFGTAERRNVLCLVASPDGSKGSLRTHQDALVYSCVMDPGQHIIHELAPGRSAWLHIVRGEATFGDIVMTTGDGVGVLDEPSVSLTSQEITEILLVDLGKTPGRSRAKYSAECSAKVKPRGPGSRRHNVPTIDS